MTKAELKDYLVDLLIDGALTSEEDAILNPSTTGPDGPVTFDDMLATWEESQPAQALKMLSKAAYKERRKDFIDEAKAKFKKVAMAV